MRPPCSRTTSWRRCSRKSRYRRISSSPALRKGTLARELTPVLIGSAYKNKGVQTPAGRRYAVCCPARRTSRTSPSTWTRTRRRCAWRATPKRRWSPWPSSSRTARTASSPTSASTKAPCARGTRSSTCAPAARSRSAGWCACTADQMEEIDTISAGYIGALFGIDCASGDTFTAPGLSLTMTSMYVPKPVISLAITPKDHKAEVNMSKAFNRFTKEDPTFKTHVNPETNETIISGMGELHLEVYIERMQREYAAEVGGRRTARRLPRDHHPAGGFRLPAQEADGRLRPVRPRVRLDRADLRQGLRIRQPGRRRLDPDPVHRRLRKGVPRVHGQRAQDGVSGHGREDRHQRRRHLTRWTPRTWPSRQAARGAFQQGYAQGQAGRSRSPS